eukprot:304048_1
MAADLINLLNTMDKTLIQMESGYVSLSEVYYRYRKTWITYEQNLDNFTLFAKLGDDLRVHIGNLFEDKWKLMGHKEDYDRVRGVEPIGLKNTTHGAVFLIDPRYRNVSGRIITPYDKLNATRVLKKWAGDDWEWDDSNDEDWDMDLDIDDDDSEEEE